MIRRLCRAPLLGVLLFSLSLPLPGAESGELQSVLFDQCRLESGEVLAPCKLSYRLFGELNADKSNAVLMPTWHNGTSADLEKYGYLGPGKMVDSDRYFVIAVDAFANGESASPSNTGDAPNRGFPEISIRDMTHSQYRLIREHLGLEELHAVVGVSMGGYQAFEWMMMYPRFADRYLTIESAPWLSLYDYLQRRAFSGVLNGPLESEEELRFASDMVTALDAVTLWTPDYVNREFGDGDFNARFEALRRHQGLARLLDRASQARANSSHDIRRDRGDFTDYLHSLGRLNVLSLVYTQDLRVNPGPVHELAAMMDFPVISIDGDCGHMGPNPECYQEQTAAYVQAFLDADHGGDPPGLSRHTLQYDGTEREYLVYRPPGTENRELPLVLALHGYGTTSSGLAATYGLNTHAEEHGYTIIYPQGSQFMGRFGDDRQSEPSLVTSWNDLASNFTPAKGSGPHCTDDRYKYPCPPECGSCNHCAWTSCYDDLGFLQQVLDSVQGDFSIDAERVYLLGVSNGAMMAMRLGCSAPDRFAAVAALIAQMPPGFECSPGDTGLPLFHLAGEKDDVVGHDGTATSAGWIFASRKSTQAIWAAGMGCDTAAGAWRTSISDSNGLACTAIAGCPNPGNEVVACLDPATGHEWRGQRATGVPANCVYPMQSSSFPDQPLCGSYRRDEPPWGMDLVWQFLSRFERETPAGVSNSNP